MTRKNIKPFGPFFPTVKRLMLGTWKCTKIDYFFLKLFNKPDKNMLKEKATA